MNCRQFFEMHAKKWDTYITKNLLKKLENIIIPKFNIKKSERILDVGSGTGILLPYLRKATGKKGYIVALDYSRAMIRKAEEKYGSAFKYVCASAEKVPYKSKNFDKVICFNVFPHFSKKQKAVKELFRILKTGGKIFIAHSETRIKINNRHSKIGGPVGKDRIPEKEKMAELLCNAGFKHIKITEGKNYYMAEGQKN